MTSPVDTTAESTFAAIAARLLREPDTREGPIFHSSGLKVHGKVFTLLSGDRLVVKLPAERCAELVAGGAARPFQSGRRVMREWVSIGDPDPRAWLELAEEALAFGRAPRRPSRSPR